LELFAFNKDYVDQLRDGEPAIERHFVSYFGQILGMMLRARYLSPERVDDVRTVMDAAGSERAALLSIVDGGRMAMVFAASHPERTAALILVNSAARFLQSDDYPCGVPPQGAAKLVETIGEQWGTGAIIDYWAPTKKDDPEFRRWWARYQRMSASPQMGQSALLMAIGIDVRHVLPTIQAPTLVLQRANNPLVSVEHGRYLAEHIANARYVELPGVDFFLWTADTNLALGEIEEFLTGARTDIAIDRMLATIMFTDIVSSTEHLVAVGDGAWSESPHAITNPARSTAFGDPGHRRFT